MISDKKYQNNSRHFQEKVAFNKLGNEKKYANHTFKTTLRRIFLTNHQLNNNFKKIMFMLNSPNLFDRYKMYECPNYKIYLWSKLFYVEILNERSQ